MKSTVVTVCHYCNIPDTRTFEACKRFGYIDKIGAPYGWIYYEGKYFHPECFKEWKRKVNA